MFFSRRLSYNEDMLAAIAAFIVGSSAPNSVPGFATVFGAHLGNASPSRIERRFGAGLQTVRKADPFDDGWDWWTWPAAHGDVQIYWEPAYPASRRRITSFWLTSSMGRVKPGLRFIAPSRKLSGWLAGIRIGMPERECVRKLEALFGVPSRPFGEYAWTSVRFELDVDVHKGRLIELYARFIG